MKRHVVLPVVVAAAAAFGSMALGGAASVAATAARSPQPAPAAESGQSSERSTESITNALLRPAKKYNGIYVSTAPAHMAPIQKVTAETGKQPNLSLFYENWGPRAAAGKPNFAVNAARNACRSGMLPMLTWESWNTQDAGRHGTRVSQPAFAPIRIIRGHYDAYIRATAERIKSLGCPIALRLDQEVNSYWYPWAINTAGMHNSAHLYVRMWRHVWRIFHAVHATNVLWVWSPNIQSRTHRGLPSLAKSYPGHRYVGWVGIDGYFFDRPHETFHDLFGATIAQLRHVAPHKPWIIAEAGVGAGPSKPRQIRELFAAVARSPRFVGVNYFDTDKPGLRSDWTFTQTAASLAAYKAGVHNPAYAWGDSKVPLGN
jgi:Glycosyl hydrolase family 26